MQQQSGQTIYSYISELQALWHLLASCDLAWPSPKTAKVYVDLRDGRHV